MLADGILQVRQDRWSRDPRHALQIGSFISDPDIFAVDSTYLKAILGLGKEIKGEIKCLQVVD
ncbi:unnamed protein product [Amoebophrya sp. A120]|nr:unnamed protein product [Amoebophrya sp. A120]CAD7975869.1 unnamed protein product [Amoebophrya sp. A120]|eukprot:GSA120T00026250001.1